MKYTNVYQAILAKLGGKNEEGTIPKPTTKYETILHDILDNKQADSSEDEPANPGGTK